VSAMTHDGRTICILTMIDEYTWKKQYVGLEFDQIRQLKQLQEENTPLKQLVADLTLDKAMLQDVLSKKF